MHNKSQSEELTKQIYEDVTSRPVMIDHKQVKSLFSLIRSGKIRYAGNKRLKIYGTLQCSSGRRMKKENRVFFKNENEAVQLGFRPCGHCMRKSYRQWKIKNS
jgi:hypothetical protein